MKKRILIVEDEALMADRIREMLSALGYEITAVASSGSEAIRKASETHPDLLLMDIVLQGEIDGVRAAEHIRSSLDIPVVYLTAYADDAILQRAKITEPYGYILKPFEKRELQTNIEIALYKHRIARQLRESRRRAEEERAKAEAIIEAIGDGFSIQDTDYKLLYMNRISREMFGDRVGENCYRVYEGRDRVCPGCPLARSFSDGQVHRTERSNPTRDLHVEITASPIRDPSGRIVAGIEVVRDITKRRKAEEALRESEERYRTLFEGAHDMIQSVDAQGRFIFVNPAWLRTMGYTADELKEMTIFDVLHPSCRDHCLEAFRKVLSGEATDNIEATFVARDGRLIEVEGNVNVRMSGGRVIATKGIFRDVTERRKMEREILRSKQDWENTFNTITDIITVHDGDLNIIHANKAAERILAMPDLEVTRELNCRVHDRGEDCGNEHSLGPRSLATGRPASRELFEPGLNMHFEIRAIPRFDGGNRLIGLIHVVRDITERKKAEEERARLEQQLRHSQKMEAIGTLTAGISHEFKNVLTSIIGYSEFLLEGLASDSPMLAYANIVYESARRAERLTQGLLAYSRRQIIHLRPVRLADIVERVRSLLSKLIGEHIRLVTTAADEDLTVMADPDQIEQVLVNLCLNAMAAMPDRGVLTVTTERVRLDEGPGRVNGHIRPGVYALISVSDTGTGIDEKTIEKIFEPFFTTKEPGRGTGLGLSMAYGIVKQHKGHIELSSEPGKGTSVRVYLPAESA